MPAEGASRGPPRCLPLLTVNCSAGTGTCTVAVACTHTAVSAGGLSRCASVGVCTSAPRTHPFQVRHAAHAECPAVCGQPCTIVFVCAAAGVQKGVHRRVVTGQHGLGWRRASVRAPTNQQQLKSQTFACMHATHWRRRASVNTTCGAAASLDQAHECSAAQASPHTTHHTARAHRVCSCSLSSVAATA